MYRKESQNSLESLIASEELEQLRNTETSTEEQQTVNSEQETQQEEKKQEKEDGKKVDLVENEEDRKNGEEEHLDKVSRRVKVRRRGRLPRKSYGADYSPPPRPRYTGPTVIQNFEIYNKKYTEKTRLSVKYCSSCSV